MDFTLVLRKKLPPARKREKRVLITAFPGIASVGLILADVLEESLSFTEHGWFKTRVRPTEIPVEENMFVPPRITLSHARTRSASILLVQSPYQPEGVHAWALAEALVTLAKKEKMLILTTGGIGIPGYPEEPRVFGIRNAKAQRFARELEKHGVGFTLSEQIGMLKVYGMTGILPVAAEEAGVPAISLLAETIAAAESIGFTSAKALALILGKYLAFTPRLERLEEDARVLREAFTQKEEKREGEHGIAYIG